MNLGKISLFGWLFIGFGIAAHSQGSLDYDGSNDYVSLPNGLVSSLSSDYTIEAWAYWRGASASGWQRIFDFGTGTTAYMFLTTCYGGSSNIPRFAISTSGPGGEQQLTSSVSISLNAWHHFALVYNSATTTGTLYIDGSSVATNTAMTITPSALAVTTNNYLGRSEYPDPYFNGLIDEFRISNVMRYTSGFTPQHSKFSTDANTVALYHFDESSGQTVTDATGTYNGTLGADATVESSDPTWTSTTILPVSIAHFNAQFINNKVQLQWQTASEENNKGFYIERSTDRNTFITIGFEGNKGDGSEPVYYSFDDDLQYEGNVYYRLKQADADGHFSYSSIVSVTIPASSPRLYFTRIAEAQVEVRLTGGSDEAFFITDINGRLLKKGKLVSGRIRLDLMPSGFYTVTIKTKAGTLSGITRLW